MAKDASARGKAARKKGKSGELEVVHILQDHGFIHAHRTQQFSGKEGTSDVTGLPGFHIEVKRREKYDVRKWWQQAVEDARTGEKPLVVFRSNGESWKVMMSLEDFLGLLDDLLED